MKPFVGMQFQYLDDRFEVTKVDEQVHFKNVNTGHTGAREVAEFTAKLNEGGRWGWPFVPHRDGFRFTRRDGSAHTLRWDGSLYRILPGTEHESASWVELHIEAGTWKAAEPLKENKMKFKVAYKFPGLATVFDEIVEIGETNSISDVLHKATGISKRIPHKGEVLTIEVSRIEDKPQVPDFVGKRFRIGVDEFVVVPDSEPVTAHGTIQRVKPTYRSLYVKSGQSYPIGDEATVRERMKGWSS